LGTGENRRNIGYIVNQLSSKCSASLRAHGTSSRILGNFFSRHWSARRKFYQNFLPRTSQGFFLYYFSCNRAAILDTPFAMKLGVTESAKDLGYYTIKKNPQVKILPHAR